MVGKILVFMKNCRERGRWRETPRESEDGEDGVRRRNEVKEDKKEREETIEKEKEGGERDNEKNK